VTILTFGAGDVLVLTEAAAGTTGVGVGVDVAATDEEAAAAASQLFPAACSLACSSLACCSLACCSWPAEVAGPVVVFDTPTAVGAVLLLLVLGMAYGQEHNHPDTWVRRILSVESSAEHQG
jgi:hypothetical protein